MPGALIRDSLILIIVIAVSLLPFIITSKVTPNNIEVKSEVVKILEKNKYSVLDRICLEQNIHYEADGEPFYGKVAVAIVTLNRSIRDNKKICDIVFEPYQFSWTLFITKPKTIFSLDTEFAANLVLNKLIKLDNLENAIYFHEATINPSWARGKKKIIKIGNHIFYAEK